MTWNVPNVIALIGVALLVLQFYLARRKEQFEGTMWIFERLQGREATEARFAAEVLIAKARKTPAANTPIEYDFDKLRPRQRARLASIGGLFGLAGLLYKRRRIDRRLFLDAWGNSAIVTFERLTPYMHWRDRKLGPQQSLWRHFEFLAATARLEQRSGSSIQLAP